MDAFNRFFTPVRVRKILRSFQKILALVYSLKSMPIVSKGIITGRHIIGDDPHKDLATTLDEFKYEIKQLRLERFEIAEYLSSELDSAYNISEVIEKTNDAIRLYASILYDLKQDKTTNEGE